MTDLYDNDASHGQEQPDEIEPSKEAHFAARNTILDTLKDGSDIALRETAIKELSENELFWDRIFSIGANTLLSHQGLIDDSINVGVSVFASVSTEIYDLAIEIETEVQL